jgi:hypothetical protein
MINWNGREIKKLWPILKHYFQPQSEHSDPGPRIELGSRKYEAGMLAGEPQRLWKAINCISFPVAKLESHKALHHFYSSCSLVQPTRCLEVVWTSNIR